MAKKKQPARWSKDTIRAEIRRLDAMTGLNGSAVTVRLYTQPEPLGLFTFIDPVRMTFGFSSARFEDPKFTKEEALDVIRHEYAHYMEYALYGESTDHGKNWKSCCRRIGARPENFYTKEWADYARGKQKRLQERTRTDGLAAGRKIVHPSFGEGMIEEIRRLKTASLLTIRFADCTKTLDAEWTRKNCQYRA